MPRSKTSPTTLTIGQLARRWNVSPTRVRSLIEAGEIRGAFRIPSVGRHGETLKVPLESVEQAEAEWAIIPRQDIDTKRKPPRTRGGSLATLKHFPELNNLTREFVSESLEAGQR